VAVRARSEPRGAGDFHLERLLDCDETLAGIASDVEGLLEELAQMRGRAEVLEERCAEQDGLLREREADVARLEDVYARAARRVEELGDALADATRYIADVVAHAASLGGERDRLRDALEERTQRLAAAERELAAAREAMHGRPQPTDDGPSVPADAGAAAANDASPRPETVTTHLRFVGLPDGYHLTTSDERCAAPGDRIVVDDQSFLVTKVGRSPLPDDPRLCAFLLPDARRP
jgi:hypothetical protein